MSFPSHGVRRLTYSANPLTGGDVEFYLTLEGSIGRCFARYYTSYRRPVEGTFGVTLALPAWSIKKWNLRGSDWRRVGFSVQRRHQNAGHLQLPGPHPQLTLDVALPQQCSLEQAFGAISAELYRKMMGGTIRLDGVIDHYIGEHSVCGCQLQMLAYAMAASLSVY